MRRSLPGLLTAAATLVVLGCGESTVAPTNVQHLKAPGGAQLDLSAWSSSSTWSYTQDITITPAGGDFNIGNGLFFVHFPASAVCDPATSSYGPGTWDSPCSPATGNVTLHVTYGVYGHHVYADFSPAVRFVPSSDPAQWVTFGTALYASYLTSNAASLEADPSPLKYLGILYGPQIGTRVDDVTDSTLFTVYNVDTGFMWRRIKHFSGYNVLTGKECTPSPDDPDCIDTGDGGTVQGGT